MNKNTKLNKGIFFVIEGIDGAGKSTQIKMLADWLTASGYDVVVTREPTDESVYGRTIRAGMYGERSTPEEELDLFILDRKEHIRNLIAPALKQKKIVICDRYYFSNIAYQGAAGLDTGDIRRLNEAFSVIPDAVFYLRISVDEGLHRIQNIRNSELTSFEKADFLHKVKEIFDAMADEYFHRIDASVGAKEVSEQVVEIVKEMLYR